MTVTVHNYLLSSTVLSRTAQDKLLSQGRSLALPTLGWNNPALTRSLLSTETTVYRFAYAPPSRPPSGVRAVKEWNSVVTQDEIFILNDLDEFVNTDLTSIFERRSEPPPKRRKLETGPLYGFIPKPHVYPSPFSPSPSPPKGKPFQKTEPILIVPNLTFSLPDDARVAWLIPIRGVLPWENCTSGALLDSSHNIPTPSSPVIDDQISWTQRSILKFWDFLLLLRQAGKLGPLGISLNCSSQFRTSPVATTTDTLPCAQETRNLSMVDYIKVNHDAPCRLYVRSALDAWSFQTGDTEKIRLLKGARLVLVDSCSRGIQIS